MKPQSVLVLLLVLSGCQAKTLTVDGGGSGDARTLQEAVVLAGDGDSILLKPGNYSALQIDKSLNISGSPGAVLQGPLVLAAPGCQISNITIADTSGEAAVSLFSSGNRILRCAVSSLAKGISVSGADNSIEGCRIDSPEGIEISGAGNAIAGCTISGDKAISLRRARGGRVEGCQISSLQGVAAEECREWAILNNTYAGSGLAIALSGCEGNLVSGNNLSGSLVGGIDLLDSRDNNLSHNSVTGAQVGISLRRSGNCSIISNLCHKNERAGLFLEGASGNILLGNSLSGNGNGILLQDCGRNTLIANMALQNQYGITLRGCGENTLRENRLSGNSYNLRIDSGPGEEEPGGHDFFVQDIDESNLAENRSVFYMVGKSDLVVPSDCGFLGLISCRNVRASGLNISNSSVGALLVNCTGSLIQGSVVSRSEWGYLLRDCLSCIISGSRAENCTVGFAAESSSGCQFARDQSINCTGEGMLARRSQGLGLVDFDAHSCQRGLSLHDCRLCRIQSCNASNSLEEGILLSRSHNCTLLENGAFSNRKGISLAGSHSSLLQANNASGNEEEGISLQQLSDADLRGNAVRDNGQGMLVQYSSRLSLVENVLERNQRFGLRMSGSRDCKIRENRISYNGVAGINLVDCSRNAIYHNVFMDNGMQNAADNGGNQWDAGEKEGGNYWSDYPVEGNPSCEPRQISGGGTDRYPFADPWGWR